MPRFRVTLSMMTEEIVDADNPFQAALIASQLSRHSDAEIADVRSVLGRPAAGKAAPVTSGASSKTPKKVAKKRRPMSAENRAKLAQNLVKARAARAAKAAGIKKTVGKKTTTKRVAGRKATTKGPPRRRWRRRRWPSGGLGVPSSVRKSASRAALVVAEADHCCRSL